MTAPSWTDRDHRALQAALHAADAASLSRLLARPLDGAPLQFLGEAALVPGVDPAAAARVAAALEERDGPGDDLLAAEIAAALGTAPPPEGRPLPVDLEDVALAMSGGDFGAEACIDLATGDVRPRIPGDDPEFDEWVEEREEGEGVLWIEQDSREAWRDMERFAASVDDDHLRNHLLDSIRGKGAFGRFKAALGARPGMVEEWYLFQGDRERGRARDYLAEEGIRALPPRRAEGG